MGDRGHGPGGGGVAGRRLGGGGRLFTAGASLQGRCCRHTKVFNTRRASHWFPF